MIATNQRRAETCEHYVGVLNKRSNEPWVCKAGVDIAAVRTERGPGAGILSGLPCFGEGRACGATCDRCLLPTREQLDDRARELTAIMDGIAAGTCGVCGKMLLRRGTAYACPDGHVSGFMCGPKDIREGAPVDLRGGRRE